MRKLLAIAFLTVLLASLSSGTFANDLCPKNYNPVCARTDSGEAKTFGNMCMALGSMVISQGACSACPDIYQPVCGKFTGGERTYGNACEAKRAGVFQTTSGMCAGDEPRQPTAPTHSTANCPRNYAPICGLDMSGNEKTYSNMCQLRSQNGDAIHKGTCSNSPTNQATCPRNYAPVCGQIGRSRTTYSNDCQRKSANARLLYNGRCR
ncbi:MAG: hypothetical protein JKY46_09990 [Robiginitomaculum sp.]|nr:hypothetical protein [Robiginitomaculum sp.]